jgi:hypothetical protein
MQHQSGDLAPLTGVSLGQIDTSGFQAGPEMNAPYRTNQSFLPAHRRQQLTPTATRQTANLRIAALNRPEASGPLMVRVGSNDADYYTIEYRMRSGWDQGIPRDAVLLHRVQGGVSRLITGGGADRVPGTTYAVPGGLTLTVNSFAAEGYTANITVQY